MADEDRIVSRIYMENGMSYPEKPGQVVVIRDEGWASLEENGVESARYNLRYVVCIRW